jgi:CTD kinase subunit gamma
LKDENVKNALQLLHDKMVAVQLNGSTSTSTSTSTNTSTDSKIKPMTKEEILKRMDDDRERSKRPKENIWAVDYEGSLYNEFEALWDIAEMTDLDYEQMKEDSEIAKASVTA